MHLTEIQKNGYADYAAGYDSALLRGQDDPETPRPWNVFAELVSCADKNKVLLDIGCGTAFKTIPLASYFQTLFALDPSQGLLEIALKNAQRSAVNNIHCIKARGEQLPFADHSIDVITCMLSRWDISEIHRILKPNGKVVIEHIGCEDKKRFKSFFGKDASGWRGQLIDYSPEIYLAMHRENFSKFFHRVSIKNGFWDTCYTLDGLQQLLLNTPSIRHYDVKKDKQHLLAAYTALAVEGVITLTQNRILIHAENPRTL